MPVQDIPNNLPHTMNVSQMRTTQDALGGDVPAPVSVATGVACFVQTASQREIDKYSKRGYSVTHRIFYRPGDVALAEDSIIHTLAPTTEFLSTARYRVVALADATTNLSPTLHKAFAIEEFGDVEHQA